MQSFRLSMRSVARQSPMRRPIPQQSRTFTSALRMHIKEDANRSAEELDKKKHEQLNKQKRGEGEWHEELASAGEANIKADKHDVEDHDSHMDDLQKQTAEKHEKDHPHGKAEH